MRDPTQAPGDRPHDGPALDHYGTSRVSRLHPGPRLAHADLHNHSRLSDADGDPTLMYKSLRAAGLDVAALTDHARPDSSLLALLPRRARDRSRAMGADGWALTRRLAAEADDPGSFVALHGFEWSHPTIGHACVWDSADWTDPLRTGMRSPRGLYRWLRGPGADALAGFNHPGSMGGDQRFDGFRNEPEGRGRMVSLEVFNRQYDHLFDRKGARTSPLNQALNAGWKVGLLGVTDEHGTDWGTPDGKGRAGLYVDGLTVRGVRDALTARRFFASRVKGLRLDATARVDGGPPVRMGGDLPVGRGSLRIMVDLDRGSWNGEPAWPGRRVGLQVLRPGTVLPVVAAAITARVPRADQAPLVVEVEVDAADGPWVVLRVTDPDGGTDPRATGDFAGLGEAVAYASPWWLVEG